MESCPYSLLSVDYHTIALFTAIIDVGGGSGEYSGSGRSSSGGKEGGGQRPLWG